MTGALRSYSTQTAHHMPGAAHPTAALRPDPAAEAVYRLTFAPSRGGDLDPPEEAVSWLMPVHRRVRRPGLVSGCRWSANACSIAVLRPGPASGYRWSAGACSIAVRRPRPARGCPFHCDDQRGPEAYEGLKLTGRSSSHRACCASVTENRHVTGWVFMRSPLFKFFLVFDPLGGHLCSSGYDPTSAARPLTAGPPWQQSVLRYVLSEAHPSPHRPAARQTAPKSCTAAGHPEKVRKCKKRAPTP